MDRETSSPIALFVAISVVLREATIPDALRAQAFDALERLARQRHGRAREEREADLMELAAQHPALARALQPYWTQLQQYVGDAHDLSV